MFNAVDVEIVPWPTGREVLEVLRTRGVPRLLVVAEGDPPALVDCLEDWVAPGAGAREVERRRGDLARRAVIHATTPHLDGDGLLHHRDGWVALSPVEQALAAALVEHFGAVVARDALAARAWPVDPPTRNALDVHMLRLRRRISPLGLEVRTVRARGYVLQRAAS